MEYIERLGQKIVFSPWGLGYRRTREGGEGEGSLGGGGPWGAALLTLGMPSHQRGRFEKVVAG
jgi:hypothetical protein